MNKFIFTIGSGQYNDKLHNCYIIIEAEDESSARLRIYSKIGRKWAFSYAMNNKTEEMINTHHMTEVSLDYVSELHLEIYPDEFPNTQN